MAVNHTAEEVEQLYICAMGANLGKLFYCLWNECALLHLKWGDYVVLFGTKPERIDLMNKVAPSFFRLLQDSLWDDLLLHLSRLTDNPKSMNKENLTVRQLPGLVSSEISQNVDNLLAQVVENCKFARDWRCRRIAHRDLALALGRSASSLAAASRQDFKNALDALVSLLNAVELNYKGSTTLYDKLAPRGNAEELLSVLRDGLDAKAGRRNRIRAGKPLPEDMRHKPAV